MKSYQELIHEREGLLVWSITHALPTVWRKAFIDAVERYDLGLAQIVHEFMASSDMSEAEFREAVTEHLADTVERLRRIAKEVEATEG
jgi:hypothetical protein